jgi:predicted Zn finger-like uncharacterized protein
MAEAVCPLCGTKFYVQDAQPGTTIRCTLCANEFRAQEASPNLQKPSGDRSIPGRVNRERPEPFRRDQPRTEPRGGKQARRPKLLAWIAAPFVALAIGLMGLVTGRGVPANGTTLMTEGAIGGRGELEAVNGTQYDACVLLIEKFAERRVRFFFVRSKSSAKTLQLAPGEYRILFATGRSWNRGQQKFTKEAQYFEFDRTLTFEEKQVEGGFVYSQQTVTLNAVPDGNARTRSISEAEFLSLQKR